MHTLERLGTNAMKASRPGRVHRLAGAIACDQLCRNHFPSLLCLGHALKTLGRQDEAIDAYRRCIDAKPDFGEAYWSLANLKTFRFDDDELTSMAGQLNSVADAVGEEAADAEIAFSFALGKALGGSHSSTRKRSTLYHRGNSKKRFAVNHDPIEFQDNNDRIIEVFNREKLRRARWLEMATMTIRRFSSLACRARGQTLLEQILAMPPLAGGGQLAELHHLVAWCDTGRPQPDRWHPLPTGHARIAAATTLRAWGRKYIGSTRSSIEPARASSPSKMPNNFTAIGFLHTILPNAKVIDARRHPLDSCLGTFKQLFANGQVFFLRPVRRPGARLHPLHAKLMDHWAEAACPARS